MFSVQNNRMALNAQRQFKSVGKEKKKTAERLSTGQRMMRQGLRFQKICGGRSAGSDAPLKISRKVFP